MPNRADTGDAWMIGDVDENGTFDEVKLIDGNHNSFVASI